MHHTLHYKLNIATTYDIVTHDTSKIIFEKKSILGKNIAQDAEEEQRAALMGVIGNLNTFM